MQALETFDASDRASPEWSGWEWKPQQLYALEFEGRLYPPKRIIELATGAGRRGFSGGAQANSYLERYNFMIVPINHPNRAAAELTVVTPATIVEAFQAALDAAEWLRDPAEPALVPGFIASLLTKPFAILTGLSGSGKTQLAIKLGEWFGPGHSVVVPVRPDWTGPESLLGFEDALRKEDENGNRPWSVPLPLEFMLRAAGDPERPYLLVLDEMNLAHVERYFADVLSGMESREPVLPNLHQRGSGWFVVDPAQPRIAIPRNLFVVGTINVDETTYMFSPKVLDRANTLEFRVSTHALPRTLSELSRPGRVAAGAEELLTAFVAIARDDGFHQRGPTERIDGFAASIREVHALLSAHGFEFGRRTYYEGVRLAALFASSGDWSDEELLDLFLLQKILPRLHGNRRRLEPLLKSLATFATHGRPGMPEVDVAAFGEPASLARSFAKLARMMRALHANQFASFSD